VARRREVIARCGLKTQANNTCSSLLMVPARGQLLDLGNRRGAYSQVEYVGRTGWVLSDNLEDVTTR
jgi:hypothetical protein